MKKQEQITYSYPNQIQKQFHTLMQSKESFSAKLLPADKRRLDSLYQELESVYNQNNILDQQSLLMQKSQELRDSQIMKKLNYSNSKEAVEKDLENQLNLKREELSRKQLQTVYFGESDHMIPWQTDHLNRWRANVANAIEALTKVMI